MTAPHAVLKKFPRLGKPKSPGLAAVEIRDLSKRFGAVAAVNHLSFDIEPGRVTGFLGPNGAGKSTTLRALLGLVQPSSGAATFGGLRYDELDEPSACVGAVLEDASFHPGRSARNHLRVLAITGNHPPHRVEEVLSAVGLSDAADRRVKGYSMGMRQRLAIAAALLGDPQVLILDEPTNGLDPPGITWLRGLMREQAADGRAVLVSSHVLAEVAQSVDDVVVIADGELRAQGPLEQVLGGSDGPATTVRAQDPVRLTGALERRGHRVDRDGDVLNVLGATPEEVGNIAGHERLAVLGLAPRTRSLEEAFIALTGVQS
jgi:ABC-2 type transport system ATP-binding protein